MEEHELMQDYIRIERKKQICNKLAVFLNVKFKLFIRHEGTFD